MRISWDPKALAALEAAGMYIAEDDPTAASRLAQRIFEAVDSLIPYPLLGRAGRVVGTRELVISRTPYIAVYRMRGQAIEVLAVLHTARAWPDRFD